MNRMKKAGSLLMAIYESWSEDKVTRLAAALAYYAVFSIAPLLIIFIAVAGFFFGTEAAQSRIMDQVRGFVGDKGASGIQAIVAGASRPQSGLIASALGGLMLLVGATGVFTVLQDSLNTIWEVQPKPDAGLMHTIVARVISFLVVLGIGALLLASIVISSAISAVGRFLPGGIGNYSWALHIVNLAVSFGIITVLFAVIFKFLPDAKIAWRDVWKGSALTALLFIIGEFLIGLYLGKSSFNSSYGAVGSILILIVWIYYSSLILFFGAEFTKVYADRYGSRIKPAPGAEPVTQEARAEQGIPARDQPEKK